jgi:hypothetical protein
MRHKNKFDENLPIAIDKIRVALHSYQEECCSASPSTYLGGKDYNILYKRDVETLADFLGDAAEALEHPTNYQRIAMSMCPGILQISLSITGCQPQKVSLAAALRVVEYILRTRNTLVQDKLVKDEHEAFRNLTNKIEDVFASVVGKKEDFASKGIYTRNLMALLGIISEIVGRPKTPAAIRRQQERARSKVAKKGAVT